ncbi:MAG: GspH/FimT family pseudopilin [Coxiellaceae bacterium]|nr:GspH/FimT family pseudopilin [Coxiellaceae bacterium]
MIELLVTAALIAGLLVVSIVTFDRWIDKNQLIKTTDSFIDTLEFARNSAMASNALIEVCPRDPGEKCGANWDAGQLVLDFQNEKVLRVEAAVPDDYFILWRPTLTDLPLVRFKPDGFLASGLQGSFYICAKKKHADSAKIVLLRSGRTRALTGDFPACHS